MNLTARLKQWAIKNADVESTATDEVFRKAISESLANGDLTPAKFAELTSTKSDEEADEFSTLMKGVLSELKSISKSMSDPDEDDEDEDEDSVKSKSKKSTKTAKGKKPCKEEMESEDDNEEEMAEKKSVNTEKKSVHVPSLLEKMVSRMGGTPDDMEDGQEKSFEIRIKSAIERYDDTKSTLTYPMATAKGRAHPLAGQPVTDFNESGKGRVINTASEKDVAIAGAYGQFLVKYALTKSRRSAFESLPEHSKNILIHTIQNEKWGGYSGEGGDSSYSDIDSRKLSPREQKALLDDSTSGGLEAAPTVFDDQVIQAPSLNGELYPYVNTVPLDRGRRVEGVAIGKVTGSWGGVDDTAIALFNTTSYVTAFDTTIFRWEGAIQIGLDFLSDTPIDFGAIITAQYGERLLEDLDDVIATGNGSTQPEGITVKAGTTSVSFGGTTSLGNYESLRFGVAKPEHKSNTGVFCGSETSYQRARAIPVGASDARRLGGSQATIGGVSDYGNYTWMGLPYKINESLGNTKIFYAILARYRMYRRRGFTMRTSTEGSTLMRANSMLMIAMARFAGQLERGACAAVTSTAPA